MNSTNNTYRVIALTMAFVMFATSVNLAIDMHYCQGQFKSLSFFGKAKTCHEITKTMTNCPHHQKMVKETEGCSNDKKNCCDSKSIQIQSDLDQIHSSNDFVVSQELQQFVLAFIAIFFKNNFIEKDTPKYTHYQSPIIPRDTYALFETYLL